MIGEQVSLQEFLRGFTAFTKDIPLKTVAPQRAPSYTGRPARIGCRTISETVFRAPNACERIFETINHAEHTLVIVTVRRVPLAWTNVEDLFSWKWELFVVIWSPEQNLLFINSSTNSWANTRGLPKAIAGEPRRSSADSKYSGRLPVSPVCAAKRRPDRTIRQQCPLYRTHGRGCRSRTARRSRRHARNLSCREGL